MRAESRSRSPLRPDSSVMAHEYLQAAQHGIQALKSWEECLLEREARLIAERLKVANERTQLEAQNAASTVLQAQNDVAQSKLRDERSRLDEEAAQLEKERNQFECEKRIMKSEHASASDIIGINMGGEKIVQVKRSLLTQFDGSLVAAMFSGRWESHLTRDGQGNAFFDHPPEVLMPVIKWLRACRDATPGDQVEGPIVAPEYRKAWVHLMNYFGFSADQLRSAGLTLKELWRAGHPVAQHPAPPSRLTHFFVAVETEQWKFETLCDLYDTFTTISFCFVFCNTDEKVDWLVGKLEETNFDAVALHNSMSIDDLDKARSSIASTPIIVTSQCVDLADQRSRHPLLVYYDLPVSAEIYLHRLDISGVSHPDRRRQAVIVNFVTNDDIDPLCQFEQDLTIQIDEMPMNVADLI